MARERGPACARLLVSCTVTLASSLLAGTPDATTGSHAVCHPLAVPPSPLSHPPTHPLTLLQSFFMRWWDQQDDDTRAAVAQLVKQGQVRRRAPLCACFLLPQHLSGHSPLPHRRRRPLFCLLPLITAGLCEWRLRAARRGHSTLRGDDRPDDAGPRVRSCRRRRRCCCCFCCSHRRRCCLRPACLQGRRCRTPSLLHMQLLCCLVLLGTAGSCAARLAWPLGSAGRSTPLATPPHRRVATAARGG